MGFRDIQAFNLALLAKQAWRLIHNTHSLFYWEYKSRYFPNCSFMDAKLGNNPSYVWKSLLAARNIIREGSKWKVGDGRTIGVSTHNWLSHEPIFLGEQQQGLMVKDLIDGHTKQWDREKIFDLFAHGTRMEILATALPQDGSRDTLICKETKSGDFLVKSAYKLAIRMKDTFRGEHSAARRDESIWRKLWRLNMPPKVCMFLWRACLNILPTRENLNKRRVQVDPMCGMCCQKPKSVEHLL